MNTNKTFYIYFNNNNNNEKVGIETQFNALGTKLDREITTVDHLIKAFKNEVSQLFKDTPIVYLKLHELQAVNQQNIQYNPTALDIKHTLAEFPNLTEFVIVNSGNY